MAYDKDKLLSQVEEAIKEHNLYFIEDVVAYLPCHKATFYEYFKVDSDELNKIKDLLNQNKVVKKVALRKKMGESERETGWLALYKLIGTEEERKKLSQTYHDLTTKDEKLTVVGFMPDGFDD